MLDGQTVYDFVRFLFLIQGLDLLEQGAYIILHLNTIFLIYFKLRSNRFILYKMIINIGLSGLLFHCPIYVHHLPSLLIAIVD